MRRADDYYEHRGTGLDYEEPEVCGYLTLHMLEFLVGRVWDDNALNVVHALRPTCIRIVRGTTRNGILMTERDCMAVGGRVTIVVDERRIIHDIEQEVEVGCLGARHEDPTGDVLAYIENRPKPGTPEEEAYYQTKIRGKTIT